MVFCARCGFAVRLARRLAFGAVLALGLLLVALGSTVPAPASAQEAGAKPAARAQRNTPKAKRARAKAAASARKPKSTPAAEKPVEEAPAPKAEREAAAPTDAQAGTEPTSTETPGEVHTEGDTQVKMMEFSGLDIEGQLKTPQMLYFLNRLRAEFGRPKLPHRSFMPELQSGTQEQSQR